MHRALVIDDDFATAELLVTVLGSLGLAVDVARDGEEGAFFLRNTRYDVLFLDLDLPIASGVLLLRLIERREAKTIPPAHVVIISATPHLAAIEHSELVAKAQLLPKPFTAADVRASMRRIAGGHGSTKPVVVVGSGLWADALARVITSREGAVVQCRDLDTYSTLVRGMIPAAIVLGPPLGDRDYVRAIALANDVSGNATRVPIVAGVRASHPTLAVDLRVIGARAVHPLPLEMSALSDSVLRWTMLHRRVDPRETLRAAALVRSAARASAALVVDVSSGGIGFDDLPAGVADSLDEVEFLLEGAQSVRVLVRTVWTAPSSDAGRVRAGARLRERAPALDRWIAERRIRLAMEDCLHAGTS